MKRSAICKFSIACAVCCGIAGGVAVAPIVVGGVFIVVELLLVLACLVILLGGAFAWLFSAGAVNIFGYGTAIYDFGLGLYHFVIPVSKFTFTYLTPIAGYVALAVGVLGIILSSVEIDRAKKQIPKAELQNNVSYEPATPIEADSMAEAPDNNKKKHPKTDKRVCVATLVVCIVFALAAIFALIVAPALV